MKKQKLICIILFAAIIGFAVNSCQGTGKTSNTVKTEFNGDVLTYNERGTNEDGYDYEFWKSNNNVTGKMTLGDGGAFKCEWSNGGNILFRSGKRYPSNQPHTAYGNFSINYSARYLPGEPGISYLSVYGWTRNPLIEYYIVESYAGSYHPGSSGIKKGSFTIDGEGTYDVYTREMYQQPAIAGPGRYDFIQYISVRTVKRTSGTISVTRHFEEWQKLGLDMSGGLYEVMMKVEGYNNNGRAEVTVNELILN